MARTWAAPLPGALFHAVVTEPSMASGGSAPGVEDEAETVGGGPAAV